MLVRRRLQVLLQGGLVRLGDKWRGVAEGRRSGGLYGVLDEGGGVRVVDWRRGGAREGVVGPPQRVGAAARQLRQVLFDVVHAPHAAVRVRLDLRDHVRQRLTRQFRDLACDLKANCSLKCANRK